MEPAVQNRGTDAEPTSHAVVSVGNTLDRVVDFSSSMKDRPAQSAPENVPSGKRDWSSALDLVSEAFEAIRMADERAAAAEEYQSELLQRHTDQLKILESRIAAAEKRADAAENRAKIAEGWLSKFHDTIVDEFQRTLVSRRVER